MDNVKEFGNITVPTSWNEINLKTFQKIQTLASTDENGERNDINIRELIKIFTDKTEDEINELPMEFLETILLHLSFINFPPDINEPTNKIIIDKEEYIVNTMEKMKTGEFVDSQQVLKDDPNNLAGILGIICRKKGEKYDSEFIAEKYEERVKMFEETPITDILPIVGFFLRLHLILEAPSLLSSMAEEEIDLIHRHIENSQNSGDGQRSSMRSAKKTLKKLRKQLKAI